MRIVRTWDLACFQCLLFSASNCKVGLTYNGASSHLFESSSNCFAELLGIEQAQRDIEELKVQLEEAKIERQHKEECEAIRKLIAAQSPRLATQKQLNELERELVHLEAENFAAHRTIELRKKQFSLLLHVVSNSKSSYELILLNCSYSLTLVEFGNVFL